MDEVKNAYKMVRKSEVIDHSEDLSIDGRIL
jgi:hypothetical protein